MNITYKVTLAEKPEPDDVEFVRKKLREYNSMYVKDDNFEHLNVFLRDSQGKIKSGLIGMTYWGWLHVEILWVDNEIRHKGYGKKVLAAAEQEAIRRGCRFAHLDTLSFQALGFYKKQEYEVFGGIEGSANWTYSILYEERTNTVICMQYFKIGKIAIQNNQISEEKSWML